MGMEIDEKEKLSKENGKEEGNGKRKKGRNECTLISKNCM